MPWPHARHVHVNWLSDMQHGDFVLNAAIDKYAYDMFDQTILGNFNPGVLLVAERGLQLDLADSLIVSDRECDIQASLGIGLPLTMLVDLAGSRRPQTPSSAVVHSPQAVAVRSNAPCTTHKI